MATERNAPNTDRNITGNNAELKSSVPNDIPDNDRDRRELESEEVIMELPDVKDIPGQEFVQVPQMGELADVTIASDDEEGVNVIGLNDDDGDAESETSGAGGDISRDERMALADDTYMPTHDTDNLRRARMDNADFEGEALNEGGFGDVASESELDVPGTTDSLAADGIRGNDEENANYSYGSDDNEASENRTGA